MSTTKAYYISPLVENGREEIPVVVWEAEDGQAYRFTSDRGFAEQKRNELQADLANHDGSTPVLDYIIKECLMNDRAKEVMQKYCHEVASIYTPEP